MDNDTGAYVGSLIGSTVGGIVGWLVVGYILGRIFVKAGEPLWAGFVPIYNFFVTVKIAGLNPWLLLLMLIPGVNVIFAIYLAIKVGEVFGKSLLWSLVLLYLFSIIGYLILAFGSDTYRRPATV